MGGEWGLGMDRVYSQNFKGIVWPSLFHLTFSLTGKAPAVVEDQLLHAFGEDECTDITCGKGDVKRRKEETVRNEGRCVAA